MSPTRPDPEVLLPDATLRRWREGVADAAGEPVAQLFAAALRRTVERTLHVLDDGTVFVITGDIPAMWLRDSATQLLPYLRLAGEDPGGPLADLIVGIVRRQTAYVRHDPYANAFNITANGNCHEPRDLSDDPWLWERKYEIDSLCFPFLLAHQLWRATGRTDQLSGDFLPAARAAVDTLRRETDHENASDYRFVRPDTIAQDTLPRDGRGSPVGWTGMTWAGFRPSDDACTYGYNIPGNLMAAHVLRLIAELAELAGVADPTAGRDPSGGEDSSAPGDLVAVAGLAADARLLAGDLVAGVAAHGVVEHPVHGAIWAYEVDGLGRALLTDDANMPGLLSLPLTAGIPEDDPLYLRTRAFVTSADNPNWFAGSVATGLGSDHTARRFVWPIGLAVEGLTQPSRQRRLDLLRLIGSTTAGTGHVHESFDVDDPARYTRPWFSWADSMFCALAMSLVD